VLHSRGLIGETHAAFLSPSLRALHDPALMPGLERAAERVLAAVRGGEPVAVYGDYDVDGITASAIMLRTLRAIRPDAAVMSYVPHRVEEGYGLNAEAITSLADRGVRVIVTVDCGITAVEPGRVAAQRGVDLVITDHHLAGNGPLPPSGRRRPRAPGRESAPVRPPGRARPWPPPCLWCRNRCRG